MRSIIELSMLFYGLHIAFCAGIFVQRKTWLNALLVLLTALVNFALNVFLIPPTGRWELR